MAVGSGVQWSSPVAWRSEPIRLPCGGGTGLSGGSPQLSSAAAVMTSAARVRRATFIAALLDEGTRPGVTVTAASPGDSIVREIFDPCLDQHCVWIVVGGDVIENVV